MASWPIRFKSTDPGETPLALGGTASSTWHSIALRFQVWQRMARVDVPKLFGMFFQKDSRTVRPFLVISIFLRRSRVKWCLHHPILAGSNRPSRNTCLKRSRKVQPENKNQRMMQASKSNGFEFDGLFFSFFENHPFGTTKETTETPTPPALSSSKIFRDSKCGRRIRSTVA